jgi:hypothetical protein
MIAWSWLACGQPTPAPDPEPAPVAAPVVPEVPPDVPVIPGPDLVGLCDASAAAAVGRWLVVADDEHNALHVYDTAAEMTPAESIALSALSPMFGGDDEADIEGMATAVDGTVWVTASHDSGKDNERKPARQRLFALTLAERPEGGVSAVLLAGPSVDLVEKGQETNQLRDIVTNTVGKTSKDPLGLSIEGLATGPMRSLLVGFRNPVHERKALVVRLDNPEGFLGGAAVKLTGPRWLALGGQGIRSMEADGDGFRLLAGPSGEEGTFSLWRWTGFDDGTPPERLPVSFGELHPEALVRVGEDWWVLSDDGTRESGGKDCKDLPPSERRARTARLP